MPKRPLVAIVDDDESIRDTTKDLLESAGLAAVTFASASLLLKSRRIKSISCLVADMRMPEIAAPNFLEERVQTERFLCESHASVERSAAST